jgi:hypothetical protein
MTANVSCAPVNGSGGRPVIGRAGFAGGRTGGLNGPLVAVLVVRGLLVVLVGCVRGAVV